MIARILVVTATALMLHAAAAVASPQQESILMDDSEFVYQDAQHVDQRMAEAKALGFDRVRVSVYWRVLAPKPDSAQKPAGDSSSPSWYGQGKWDRYDRIVQLANAHGLGVLFSITGPSPDWVTGTPSHGRDDVKDTWDPSAAEFKQFVTAIGRRYSGSYQDEHTEPNVVPLLPPTTTKSPPLPRVDHWSLWNEPNHGGWLTPQWDGTPLVPQSPRIYRGLVDAGWSGLQDSGHSGDTILIGETAPGGLSAGLTRGLRPLRFIRELYCLGERMQPLTGEAAKKRGCPVQFDPASFVAAHPGLFNASGWAHHPYSLTTAPTRRDKSRDDATLSGIPRLTNTLDKAFGVYGQSAKLPVWMTEYGYQTNPPDKTIGVPFARQASWLDLATFVAYKNPRIASFAQFLLVDDGPITQYSPDDPRYWGTFQTGLVTQQGKHKPSYESFKRPISVTPTRAKRGRSLRVFGQLRTAADGQQLNAEVQFMRRGSKKWTPVVQVPVTNPRGFLDTTVPATHSGSYRIVWSGDGSSRAAAVSVHR